MRGFDISSRNRGVEEPVTRQHSFGIVQGRLSTPPAGELQWFPQPCWQEEFFKSRALGIGFIELLAERSHNSENPLWSASGRAELLALSALTGRSIYSSCTDYIIDHSLVADPGGRTAADVHRFIDVSAELKCKVVVLPLLEQSNLTPDTAAELIPLVRSFAEHAEESGMVICVESLLHAANLREFLDSAGRANLKCVFDTGNRVVDNPDLRSEITALGSRIHHVHIKDKDPAGRNVVLGTGLVDFLQVFTALDEIGYSGPLVFETTRGTNPAMTAAYHMATCEFFSHEACHRQKS